MSKGVVALRVLMLACVAGGGAVLAQPPDSDGDLIVAWTSGHTAAPEDIFAQPFGVQPLLDVDGNGVFEPLARAATRRRSPRSCRTSCDYPAETSPRSPLRAGART